jgi:serine/threonine protein kinase
LILNYKILEEIKTNVYLVKDLKDNQLILKRFQKNESQYTSIYLHEIEVLKKLQHSNIVKVEKIEDDERYHYILFKYINGKDFKNNFSSLINQNIKCNFFKSIIKILETIDYIHTHNFIHKDIKPSNIIIDSNNNPYILDFGTATISNTITRTQQDLSLWYASPEQKNNQEIDTTTDLYSFGITLLETIVSIENFELLNNLHIKTNIKDIQELKK